MGPKSKMVAAKGGRIGQFVGYRMRVTIGDGRTLVGKFMAYDRHLNMVLSEAEEWRALGQNRGRKRKAESAARDGAEVAQVRRPLGMVILHGSEVVSVQVESGPTVPAETPAEAIAKVQMHQQKPPPQQQQQHRASAARGVPAGRGQPLPGAIQPAAPPVPVPVPAPAPAGTVAAPNPPMGVGGAAGGPTFLPGPPVAAGQPPGGVPPPLPGYPPGYGPPGYAQGPPMGMARGMPPGYGPPGYPPQYGAPPPGYGPPPGAYPPPYGAPPPQHGWPHAHPPPPQGRGYPVPHQQHGQHRGGHRGGQHGRQ